MRSSGLSVVTMVHDRDGERLHNLVISLWSQNRVPNEWILVNTSSQSLMWHGRPFQLGYDFKGLKCLNHPFRDFNKSRALNIGIRATSSQSKYIMCTDADMMFSTNFIEIVLDRLKKGNRFLLCKAGYLPRNAGLSNPTDDWQLLCDVAEHKSKKMSPGAIQAAERDWWFKVHGYDERFSGGLGGMDDDVRVRAQRDGLIVEWIEFEEAQALHQWHEPSPLKGQTSHLFTAEAPVIANLEGWGE